MNQCRGREPSLQLQKPFALGVLQLVLQLQSCRIMRCQRDASGQMLSRGRSAAEPSQMERMRLRVMGS